MLHKIISEGLISKSRSKSIRFLNKRAKEILNYVADFKFETDIIGATDNMQYLYSRIDIQFGRNKLFKNSQVVSVTIYDVDDCTIEVPVAVAIVLDVDNYKKLKGLRTIKLFLKELYTKLKLKHGN